MLEGEGRVVRRVGRGVEGWVEGLLERVSGVIRHMRMSIVARAVLLNKEVVEGW